MDMAKFQATHQWVREELGRCTEFWLSNGMDSENGGVYTCLDRTGAIYSTDKSVWMQGRCGWMFAHLCNQYGVKQEWLDASRSCLDFMEAHCINREAGNRMYFTVTAEGEPLRQRRYYFSEAFYAIANAEYYAATGEAVRLERARAAYDLYWHLAQGGTDPVGMGPKSYRSGRAFGIPMIYLNVSLVMLRCDPDNRNLYLERARWCVEDIRKNHIKPELGCVLENVDADGNPRLSFTDGRIVNPGHDIEGVWFLLEYGKATGDSSYVETARWIFDHAIEAGWDKEYGGLLYFVDALGRPPEAYEHDMKLWWPHNETLISSLMLYRDTGDENYLAWFYKTVDYCKEHFSDPAYGEWYGYLRRDGQPTQPSTKGSTFKGPFHLPRCLMQLDAMMSEMETR